MGRGTIFHSAFIPLSKGAKIHGSGTFGCLSVYCTTGQGNAEGTIRPVVFGLDSNRRGKNLIKDYRFVKMGTGKWRRLVGRFELLRPGTAYIAGFQILKDVPLVLDAAQLETNHLPWTASSYIPTGNGPAKRAVEVCRVGASTFPISRGTVSFWHRPTNPYYRMGYLFVHGPFDNKDRLYLHGGAAFLGMQRSRWAKRIDHLPDADGWHLLALTWDGKNAIQYFDGLEFGEKEGPFTYSGLEKFGGHFLLGSNGGAHDVGSEGVIADLYVWNSPLTADEVLRIWKGERIGSSIRSVAKKGSDPPVSGGAKNEIAAPASRETNPPRSDGPVSEKPPLRRPPGESPSATFELSSKARTTVGIYDLDGTLHRQLLLGEVKDAGKHRLLWDGRNDNGQMLPAGDYEYRVVSNNLAAEWKETVGNSGDPPWGKTAVRGGLFKALEKVGNDIVATNPLAEGNHGVQRFDPNGRVVWTSEIDPVYAYMTALAADEDFVYIAGLIRNERDARGQLYREVVWRLDAATGRNSPWKQGNVIDLNEARVAPPGRRLFDQYHNGDERYKDPLPGFEIHDMEVAGGRLYISFRREGSIRVLDLETGKLETLIKGIPAPKGIAVHGQSLFVVSRKKVLRFSLRGEPTGTAIEGLEAPYEVETDSAENLYVTDLGDSQQVKVFSRDGRLQRTFGRSRGGRIKDGSTERLFLPTGIAVHEGGRAAVADFGNGRIVTYDDRGKRGLTIEAAGFGGMDGGVSFVPGDPKMLFMSNIHVFGTLRNLNIVAYRTAAAGGNWETVYRWPDVTPVFSQEPLYARKLRNGRTYLFLLARSPSWFELMPDGRLAFCGALLHPLDYRTDTTLSPAVKKAAKSLGLLNDAGLPRCRMSWIDHNRNLKLEEGEITLQESDTRPFYTVNDASVSTEGSLHLKDYLTSTYWRFDLRGFDAAGNPLYDWESAKKYGI